MTPTLLDGFGQQLQCSLGGGGLHLALRCQLGFANVPSMLGLSQSGGKPLREWKPRSKAVGHLVGLDARLPHRRDENNLCTVHTMYLEGLRIHSGHRFRGVLFVLSFQRK